MADWIRFLIEFQNLILGVIGFSGVIITLWFNARLSRFQLLEARKHSRGTLRVALIEELKINLNSLNENIKLIDESSSSPGFAAPTDSMDEIFRKSSSQIGLLSQDEVSKVLHAYLTLQTYYTKLHFLGNTTDKSSRYVIIPKDQADRLSQVQRGVIGSIEIAIHILQKCLKTE